MLSNLSMLKCKVNENNFQFLCDVNAPTFEIKAALSEFQKFIELFEEEVKKKESEEKKEV